MEDPAEVKISYLNVVRVNMEEFATSRVGYRQTNALARRTVLAMDVAACIERCWRGGNGGYV